MSYYRTCPECGAHLDACEACDCQEIKSAAPSVTGTGDSKANDRSGSNAADIIPEEARDRQAEYLKLLDSLWITRGHFTAVASGDLIEGADTRDGDILLIDATGTPEPGQIVACVGKRPGSEVWGVMAKQYLGTWGGKNWVSTRRGERRALEFVTGNPIAFIGVVAACYDPETLRARWVVSPEYENIQPNTIVYDRKEGDE